MKPIVSTLPASMLLGLAISLVGLASASADAPARGIIPDYVESVLPWFPADTETLIVATRNEDEAHAAKTAFLRRFARQPIIKDFDNLIDKRHVLWAVHGGRNFDVISAFGTVRQEGASVIRLAKPIAKEEMQTITQTLRQRATEILRIENHEVFAFPPLKQDSKTKSWESFQVVVLDDSTIIKSSSRPYLTEFLKRINSKVADRALPKSLPEWRHINPDSDVWLLRHVPEKSSRRRRVALSGLVWTMDSGKLKLVYLPMKGHSVAHVARMPWVDRKTNKIPELLVPMLVFEEADNGAVTFRYRQAGPDQTEEDIAKFAKAIEDSPEAKSRLFGFGGFYMYSTQGIVH